MNTDFKIEVMMNPLFGNPVLPGNEKRQVEGVWLNLFMPIFFNQEHLATETFYLSATGEVTAYCLS